jgi:hypothetical protein
MTATAEALSYDASLVAEAWEVLRGAYRTTWRKSETGAISETAVRLALALRLYDDIRSGAVTVFVPGMPLGPEATAKALKFAAEGADEIAQDLAGLTDTNGGK